MSPTLLLIGLLFGATQCLGQASESRSAEPDYAEMLALNSNQLTDALGPGSLSIAVQPANLLRTTANETYLLWVELREGLLHLLRHDENGGYQTLETHPISMGKQGYGKEVEGDQRTPVGIYTITSFLPDEQLFDMYGSLADRYGVGAFPLDYPNVVDRLARRTGYGIWLHGLPKGVDSRPMLDSDGCVVIANHTLESLAQYIDIGSTRMILSETLEWVSVSANQPRGKRLESRIEAWRSAWSAMDDDRYLDFYSREFSNFNQNYQDWDSYKRRIHRAKSWVEVEVANLQITAYPSDENMVLAEFYQTYRSSNFNAIGAKQQIWRREADGVWRIVYEGGGG